MTKSKLCGKDGRQKNAVGVLTQNPALGAMLTSLLCEAGYAPRVESTLSSESLWTVVDLDSASVPSEAQGVITVSSDPFQPCDLTRPFLNRDFLALCRQRFEGAVAEGQATCSFESAGELSAADKTDQETVPEEDFVIDGTSVFYQGERILLSSGEYRLFALLFAKRGEAVSLEACAEALGTQSSAGNAPAVYVNHLRQKLDFHFNKRMIVTVRGKGYCLM